MYLSLQSLSQILKIPHFHRDFQSAVPDTGEGQRGKQNRGFLHLYRKQWYFELAKLLSPALQIKIKDRMLELGRNQCAKVPRLLNY